MAYHKSKSKCVTGLSFLLPNDVSEKNLEEMKSNSKLLHEI